jgi:epidermal growth factor receptor substrate 15
MPTPELAYRPGPLPKFEGITIPATIAPPPPGPPPNALRPQTSGAVRVPSLTPERANHYAMLFERAGAQGGVLAGEPAKQIFTRAGLPNDILGRIWNLADTEQRGALVMPEFIIAMHLIQSFRSGALTALPTVLPAGLYEAATRRIPARQVSGASTQGGSIPAVARQFTGASASGGRGSPLGRLPYSAPPQPSHLPGQNAEWAISTVEKAQFDSLYATLDKTSRGFITGDEAVPFFSNSKLPEEVLASIWDLADIRSQGHLTRDEFAVAMYLIRQQRGKADGSALPTSLPANLIPPSMRGPAQQPVPVSAAVFDPPPQPVAKSSIDDLFGLDALAPAPSAPALAPLSTGGSTGFGDPFGNTRTPMTPTSPTQASSLQNSTSFKPFNPTSSFGQTLVHNTTGGSASGTPSQNRAAPSAMDDLLGDNDPEISKKLTSETTELANLSNQIGTLSKQMQEVQGQRSTSQNELNQASTQKREFELRLSQLRTLYEQEAKDVAALQERLTASRNETAKLRTEIMTLESTHQELKTTHGQVVTALQADQQENNSLKERMRAISAEIAQLKPQLEKLRSEARQQKGLVAINKKQLSTNEGERDKLKGEAEELTRSNEEMARAAAESSRVQSPAMVASPALSTMSGNNPFFRRQPSVSSDSGSAAVPNPPITAAQNDRSFDSIFGPAFPVTSTPLTSPPPTTFRQEVEAPHNIPSPAMETALPAPPTERNELATPGLSQETQSRGMFGQHVPPPPPESRQMSSSFLPFAPERKESFTSSRQVSAPASRFGGDSTTGADTPTSVAGSTPTGVPAVGHTDSAVTSSAPVNPAVSVSPVPSEARSISNMHDSIPGAFPSEPSPFVAPSHTGGSAFSEPKDPFPVMNDAPRTPTATKDDFAAAFAGLNSTKDRQLSGSSQDVGTRAPATFNTEFPPLEEVGQDEDSDDSDEPNGFEDDFAPSSPNQARTSTVEGAIPPVSTGVTDTSTHLQSVPAPNDTNAGSSVAPPPVDAQPPPPAYDKAVTSSERAHAEVDEFADLLPAREDPTMEVHSVPSGAVVGGQSLAGTAVLVGTSALAGTAAVHPSTAPAPPAKVPVDDIDNEFDDLEDAEEGNIDDESFVNMSSLDRSQALDFDPTFDSPAASKTSEHTAQGSSSFGVGSNSFGDFNDTPSKPLPAAPPAAGMNTNDKHDWDAIFSGLDSSNDASDPFEIKAPAAATTNGTTSSLAAERPSFGRALTEDGIHDDPILKELIDMGYGRKDALSALEKYDYNLERVSQQVPLP